MHYTLLIQGITFPHQVINASLKRALLVFMLEGMYGKNIFLPISCLFFCKLYIPSFFFKSRSLWCSIGRSSTKNLLQSFSFYKPKNLFNLHKIILLYLSPTTNHFSCNSYSICSKYLIDNEYYVNLELLTQDVYK